MRGIELRHAIKAMALLLAPEGMSARNLFAEGCDDFQIYGTHTVAEAMVGYDALDVLNGGTLTDDECLQIIRNFRDLFIAGLEVEFDINTDTLYDYVFRADDEVENPEYIRYLRRIIHACDSAFGTFHSTRTQEDILDVLASYRVKLINWVYYL